MKSSRIVLPLLGALVLAAALPVTSAHASPAGAAVRTGEETPWSKGVAESDRKAALARFVQGNALLKESVFVQAAATYREALTFWDHPAIHYNLVLALLNLDQPLQMREHLEKAMRFGPAPLDQDKFEQAKAYKNLVEKQLSQIEVTCSVQGASVKMDGAPLFVAPGRWSGWVRAGPHTVVATHDDFLPNEESRTLIPGEATVVDLVLYRSEDLVRYERRWSSWVPWTVVAGGALLAGAGGGFHALSIQNARQFDAQISECGGCVPGADTRTALDRTRQFNAVALGGYALGGAALATGVVLVFMNRPEPVQVRPNEVRLEHVTLVPMIGRDVVGALTTLRF